MFLTLLGFPDTIDRLEPEIGQVGGPIPIIFGKFLSRQLNYISNARQPALTRVSFLQR